MNDSMMKIEEVPASNGWLWIKEGFSLFKKNPGMWIVLFLIYFIIAFLMSLVPFIGQIGLNLIAPVFVAGFMLACRDLEANKDLEINHLFAGFKLQATPLITVGGIYMVGIIAIVGIVFMLGVDREALKNATEGLNPTDAEVAMMTTLTKPLLMIMLLLVPLMMAYWFAPPLVLFKGLSAIDAMKQSFLACMRNMLPFLVYGLLAMVLLILAAIPFGIGLLVMIPVMMASLYVSYKDIFESDTEDNRL